MKIQQRVRHKKPTPALVYPFDYNTHTKYSRVLILADGPVSHPLVRVRHERHPTRAAVGAVNQLAAHDGPARPELRSDRIQTQVKIQVPDENLHLSRALRSVHSSLRRAAVLPRVISGPH